MKQNYLQNRIGKRFKNFSTKEVQVSEDSRTISGYGAVFGNRDKDGDVLVKGCFAKSISDRGPQSQAHDKIIFLWQHDMHEPIGKITELKEDDHGLYFEAEIDDVERGNQALKQLQSGTLDQFSIGFNYVWDKCEWDDARESFIVKEVNLHEISVVSIGANGETEFLGMKSAEDCENAYKQLAGDIDAAIQGLPQNKKQAVQDCIRKALSLAAIKPEKNPLEEKQAENTKCEKKGLFTNVKFKKEQ